MKDEMIAAPKQLLCPMFWHNNPFLVEPIKTEEQHQFIGGPFPAGVI